MSKKYWREGIQELLQTLSLADSTHSLNTRSPFFLKRLKRMAQIPFLCAQKEKLALVKVHQTTTSFMSTHK
jgi:hypothetical protein